MVFRATLQDVSFAVFGLGNKQYEHFNAMGKRTYSSLEALGGKALLRRGDGDDDGCIDDDFEKWCSELYDVLAKHPELVGQAAAQQNGHTNGIAAAATVPAYDVEVLAPGSAQEVSAFPVTGTGKDHHSPHWATITGARELHSTLSDRSCVHVEVDISGAGIHYEHGDHVAIYPQNSRKAVEEAASLLGHSPDILIKLSIPPGVSGR
jgi:NADPH-ferrihemoprotein reductase